MGLFDFLSSREKKVSNQKLEANISKLCEELTTGIIQLSEKAKQLNELKDKYNQFQSEAQTTDASSETVATKPVEEKSFLSNLFGSSEDKVTTTSPATQPIPIPIPDNNLQTSQDNINPDMLSAASTVSLEQSQAQSQAQSQSSLTDQPFKDVSQADTPQTPPPAYNSISSIPIGSDAFSSSSSSSDAMQQPVPAPAATPDAAAAPSPSLDAALQTSQMLQGQPKPPTVPDPDEASINIGGKNRKKSKRSKKTIRNSDKKSNKVTKKQKTNTADSGDSGDSKAKAQGLAQALLQAQGQS